TVQRRIRLHRDGLYRGIELSELPRDTYESPRSSQTRNEVSNAAFGLGPDFRSGAFIVCAPVGFVVVLIGIKVLAWVSFKQLARHQLRAVSGEQRIGFNDLDAKTAQY